MNKYNVGDRVKTKIHYQNDKRKVVEAIIIGVELENETNIKSSLNLKNFIKNRDVQGAKVI